VTLPTGKRAVFAFTFLQSFAGVLLSRGVYFYTHERLAFTATQNLFLGLGYGIAYIAGAFVSHRLTSRLGERRLLSWLLTSLIATHVVLFAMPRGPVLAVALPLISFFLGVHWPIVESFMSAGETPGQLLRVSSRYNVTWATSVPLGIGVSGTLIASPRPETLFLVPAVFSAAALVVVLLRFPRRLLHLDSAHPERPRAAEIPRYAALTVSARWGMMLSYSLIFLLAPLMPNILQQLGLNVARSTPAAALLDVGRLLSFGVVALYSGWRLRAVPMVAALVTLPVAFCMVLFAQHLALALAGELLLGLAAGFAYSSALYYALVVKNASVDAGGAHEALIGLGYALGPIAGLAAKGVAAASGGSGNTLGILAAALPLVALCLYGGLRPLGALRTRARAD
jgi:predicted MFS family arabinose efflux permease